MTNSQPKKSLLVGALASSFGIFVSKALGLLYYSPLSSLAGESNMSFYSITYTYYDLLLKISSAGIPFAIAALVAKYYAKEDYKTVLMVRKIGMSIVMGLSFIVALVFALMCGPLAQKSMGGAYANATDVENLKILFRILLVAVILVPYLSAIRGYYQGLKRLDLYASSQALEQFVRVFCILFFGFICVRILKLDSIYAIFMAISAAGIAAFVTIIFFKKMTRDDDRRVAELISRQECDAIDKKEIVREIVYLGVPYLAISFLGSLAPLINTTYYLPITTAAGTVYEDAKLSLGILQANCAKLASIPQVLTLGFSAGLVPYLVESLEKRDYETLSKQMTQIIETVLYILVPVIMIYICFSKDIYFIMYGNRNLTLGSDLFRASSLVTFTDTIAPILSSMMITLKLRKQALVVLVIGFLVKCLSFYPLVHMLDAYGMVISTVLCSSTVILFYLFILDRLYDIRFVQIIEKTIRILLSSLIMVLPAVLVHGLIGFGYSSRILDILLMGVLGIVMVVIYYITTVIQKLPQKIFGIKNISVASLIAKVRRR